MKVSVLEQGSINISCMMTGWWVACLICTSPPSVSSSQELSVRIFCSPGTYYGHTFNGRSTGGWDGGKNISERVICPATSFWQKLEEPSRACELFAHTLQLLWRWCALWTCFPEQFSEARVVLKRRWNQGTLTLGLSLPPCRQTWPIS